MEVANDWLRPDELIRTGLTSAVAAAAEDEAESAE
jgi:hypothetical protein